MVYTSNYFNKKIKDLVKVNISVSIPKGISVDERWKTVAPDWFTLLKPYKDGEIDDDEYTKRYLRQLEEKKFEVITEFRELTQKHDDIVLLCWCKKGNFCHRRILANWLEEQGFDEIPEL